MGVGWSHLFRSPFEMCTWHLLLQPLLLLQINKVTRLFQIYVLKLSNSVMQDLENVVYFWPTPARPKGPYQSLLSRQFPRRPPQINSATSFITLPPPRRLGNSWEILAIPCCIYFCASLQSLQAQIFGPFYKLGKVGWSRRAFPSFFLDVWTLANPEGSLCE